MKKHSDHFTQLIADVRNRRSEAKGKADARKNSPVPAGSESSEDDTKNVQVIFCNRRIGTLFSDGSGECRERESTRTYQPEVHSNSSKKMCNNNILSLSQKQKIPIHRNKITEERKNNFEICYCESVRGESEASESQKPFKGTSSLKTRNSPVTSAEEKLCKVSSFNYFGEKENDKGSETLFEQKSSNTFPVHRKCRVTVSQTGEKSSAKSENSLDTFEGRISSEKNLLHEEVVEMSPDIFEANPDILDGGISNDNSSMYSYVLDTATSNDCSPLQDDCGSPLPVLLSGFSGEHDCQLLMFTVKSVST